MEIDREKKRQEEMEKLQKRIDQLNAKKKAMKAKASAEKRKKDTHDKIVIGGAVKSVLGRDFVDGDAERLIAFLRKQDDRGGYFSKAMQIPDNKTDDMIGVFREMMQNEKGGD